MSGAKLVSILIPAYHPRFFPEALASALAQDYPELEVVVCDDSPDGAIEATVAAAGDARVRYVRNPRRLGFEGNFTECLRQSRGELMKFLNDDDRLRPQCVSALAAGLALDPRVTLATSRRAVIDEAGQPGPPILATTPVSHVSCLVPGGEMGDFCLINATNFIGEPSTAMFRRVDVAPEDDGLFTWGGRHYHCLADLSLGLRLLARGYAFYQARALSEFRLHPGQEQRGLEMDVECIGERLEIVRQARSAGFLRTPALYRAALERSDALAGHWLRHPAMTAPLAQLWLAERAIQPQYRAELERLAAALAKEIASLPP